MHHPFTQPARGNQKRRSRPEFQNPPAPDEHKKHQQSRLPNPGRSIPSPRNAQDATLHIPQIPNNRNPNPRRHELQTGPLPAVPDLAQGKRKWNLPKSRPNFLIGSKTIFDQKFFDLDLLSNKKQTKMTTRSAHQRNTILVLKFFLPKLQRRLTSTKASTTSTRLRTPLQGNKTLQCDMQ